MFRQAALPRKRNRFANAVEELGSRILRGDLKPGATLPNEADLGRELGASRTVVREAVKSLAAKGLLQPRTRTGTRILEPIHWNLLDLDVLGWRYAAMPPAQFFRELFEIRTMIEPAAAALAAERATGADIALLEQAYLAMEAVDRGSDAAIDADLQFHRIILAGSHNDLLLQMGGLISVGLLASFRISTRSYDAGLPLHKRVLEAIRGRHPEPARENMAVLLSSTREFLERELAGRVRGRVDETGQRRAEGGFDQRSFMKGTQIAETKLSIREETEGTGKKEETGRKTPAQDGEDRARAGGQRGSTDP